MAFGFIIMDLDDKNSKKNTQVLPVDGSALSIKLCLKKVAASKNERDGSAKPTSLRKSISL